DLLGQGRPDAGDLVDPTRLHEVLHVLRERFELPRGPLVRQDAERVFSEDVEHVRDFAESGGNLLVLHVGRRCPAAVFMVSWSLPAHRDLDRHLRVRPPSGRGHATPRRGRDSGDILPAGFGRTGPQVAWPGTARFSILCEGFAVHHPRGYLTHLPQLLPPRTRFVGGPLRTRASRPG